jgi:hypothetical protein
MSYATKGRFDLVGRTFGKLTIEELVGSNSEWQRVWLCRCTCGQTLEVTRRKLVRGYVTACKRCTAVELSSRRVGPSLLNQIDHERNDSRHPLYTIWYKMISRCERPTDKSYHDYGGRGIRVASRWRDSFRSFVEDVGERPSKKHSLDRIDNDGDYDLDNCRWSTATEQCNNQRPRISNNQHEKVLSENKLLQQALKDLQIRLEQQKRSEDSIEMIHCQVDVRPAAHLQYPMFDNL